METLSGWLDHFANGERQEEHREQMAQIAMRPDDLEPRHLARIVKSHGKELDALQIEDLKFCPRPGPEAEQQIVAQALVVLVMPTKTRAPSTVSLTMGRDNKGNGEAVGLVLEGDD